MNIEKNQIPNHSGHLSLKLLFLEGLKRNSRSISRYAR